MIDGVKEKHGSFVRREERKSLVMDLSSWGASSSSSSSSSSSFSSSSSSSSSASFKKNFFEAKYVCPRLVIMCKQPNSFFLFFFLAPCKSPSCFASCLCDANIFMHMWFVWFSAGSVLEAKLFERWSKSNLFLRFP